MLYFSEESNFNREIDIYFCYSSVQLRVAQVLAKQRQDNFSVLFIKSTLDFNDSFFSRVVELHFDFESEESNFLSCLLKKIFVSHKAFALVQSYVSCSERVNFFYAHLGDYLPNWAYSKYKYLPGSSFNLIQDGVLNFYRYKEKISRVFFKKLLSIFFLERFCFYREPFNIFSDEVAYFYAVFGSDLSLLPSKTISLEAFFFTDDCMRVGEVESDSESMSEMGSNNLIFYGQEPYIGSYSFDWYMSNVLLLLSFFDGQEIVYKPHPRARLKDVEEVVANIQKHFKVSIVRESDAIDCYLLGTVPLNAASIDSTALFVHKAFYKDKGYAYACAETFLNSGNFLLLSAFKRAGVIILDAS